MYFETLNLALDSENISMTDAEVMQKIGNMSYGETKRFQHQNKQIAIFRSDVSGRYEITAYNL